MITNYRVNFYPFFHSDYYYLGELNVVDMAADMVFLSSFSTEKS